MYAFPGVDFKSLLVFEGGPCSSGEEIQNNNEVIIQTVRVRHIKTK